MDGVFPGRPYLELSALIPSGRRVLYAPVQKRHNKGKSEAVVVYNTDQSLGSLGCF